MKNSLYFFNRHNKAHNEHNIKAVKKLENLLKKRFDLKLIFKFYFFTLITTSTTSSLNTSKLK